MVTTSQAPVLWFTQRRAHGTTWSIGSVPVRDDSSSFRYPTKVGSLMRLVNIMTSHDYLPTVSELTITALQTFL